MTPRALTRAGALAALVAGALFGWSALRLGIGGLPAPGPGLWPLAVSVTLIATALAVAIRPPAKNAEPITREARAVGLAVLSLIAYAYLFELVGFELPTFLLTVLWSRVLGGNGWRVTLAVAAALTAALYLIFIVGLGVSLPHVLVI